MHNAKRDNLLTCSAFSALVKGWNALSLTSLEKRDRSEMEDCSRKHESPMRNPLGNSSQQAKQLSFGARKQWA